METPGYDKPSHEHGADPGFPSLPEEVREALAQEADLPRPRRAGREENWAGKGFRRDEESTT